MEQARAFAPGNISCVFKIIPYQDPAKMHSLGMGFTVAEGVEVTVTASRQWEIVFNGRQIHLPTVGSLVGKLTARTMRIEIVSRLPLSCGFGLSGASALATAYAINALFELGLSQEDLAMAAHVAEVENLTGLGDVCAQYHGGCLAKLKEGHPLSAQPLAVPQQPAPCRHGGHALAAGPRTARD